MNINDLKNKSVEIDLHTDLSLQNSFMFPLQNKDAFKDVIIGGLLLFIPFIGWILNMGHRIMIVHLLQNNKYPWSSWYNFPNLFKHGFITFLGMIYYYIPFFTFYYFYLRLNHLALLILSLIFFLLATIAIPGYMTHYCKDFEIKQIFNPVLAFERIIEGGKNYWKAWFIALSAMFISLLGIFFGIGFLFISVWFWQVAGFSFASVFTQKFGLRIQKNL